MSNTDEKLSAILAEMRDERIIIDDANVTRCLLRNLADRIERVANNMECAFGMALAIKDGLHKRDKLSAPGNAATIREALKESTALLAVVRGDEYAENITRQIDRNTDVLSAPPRNCDRFATYEEVVKAYRAWAERTTGDVSNVSGRGMLNWLFATAEGDAE